jgi:hypothetical protein
MHFDYTYITLFGFIFFEPLVLVTNLVFFILSLIFFLNLNKFEHAYAKQMARFMLLLGISTLFGAVDHTVHYQLGIPFFKVILFLMNTFSLFSIYFCFRAPYTYYSLGKKISGTYNYFVMVWICLVLVFVAIVEDFTIIKVHAGLVLLYSLLTHYFLYKRHQHQGSRIVVTGIVMSFLPIVIHSLRISLGEWFNHKDIAHVLMICSLVIIYRGVKINSQDMASGKIA